ncbi:MAG: hypothetical protein FJ215_10450 [Ignavibacteria bacterium]|nr:hypothetical protein [Ignavibacteria bacterium]
MVLPFQRQRCIFDTGSPPIRTIDFNDPRQKDGGQAAKMKMHDDLVVPVETMLELHKKLKKADFDSEKEPIPR